jgi:hypothetical protein
MPLYLDEIWLGWKDAAQAKETLQRFQSMGTGGFGFPPGVTLKAGPWFSNEEAKIVLILDIADHAQTFVPFGLAIAHGLITRRRLTPIVEWDTLDQLIAAL